MAETIQLAQLQTTDIAAPGFDVIAPRAEHRRTSTIALEDVVRADRSEISLGKRVAAYAAAGRDPDGTLAAWERDHFKLLLKRLNDEKRIGVLSWDDAIQPVSEVDPAEGDELNRFYERCRGRPVD